MFDNTRAKIKGKFGKSDGIDVAADLAKILANAISPDAGTITGAFIDWALMAKEAVSDANEGELEYYMGVPMLPNLRFVENGLEDGPSDYTKRYLGHRHAKKFGGAAVSVVGGISSLATGANVGGVVRHGAAGANTLAHLAVLSCIAEGFRQSDWLTHHFHVLVAMKGAKLAIRGTQVAADAAGGLAGAICGLATTVTGKGVVSGMDKLITNTSMELHWRAHQEQAILRGVRGMGNGSGPASRMIKEMLTRRAHRWLGGAYDWERFVREPYGWMVIDEKLRLL